MRRSVAAPHPGGTDSIEACTFPPMPAIRRLGQWRAETPFIGNNNDAMNQFYNPSTAEGCCLPQFIHDLYSNCFPDLRFCAIA
jgi:hypothetical protein